MSDRAMLHAQRSPADLLTHKPQGQNIPTTCAVLSYEVGDYIRCALNQHWGGVRGYHGEAKVALADVITQTRLLAALLGLDFWSCLRAGEERYIEGASVKETRRDGIVRPE